MKSEPMKRMLLPFSFLLLVPAAYAQTNHSNASIGVKFGANYSNFRLTEFTGATRGDWMINPVAGAFFNVPVTGRCSIQPEIAFSAMGGTLSYTEPAVLVARQQLKYLSVPLHFKWQAVSRLALIGGPQFDFLLAAHSDAAGDKMSNTEEIQKADIALSAGLEYTLAQKILLTGRYVHGIQNVFRDDAPGHDYNTAFQITLGYRVFWKNKQVIRRVVQVKPMDADNDGVTDELDKCPAVAGLPRYQGCPMPDRDHDGIADEQDSCPDAAGSPNSNGCPILDRDGDGVNDPNDKCPDVAGLSTYNGCPETDRDHDGIADNEDRCPDVPGTKTSNGCPDLKSDHFDASTIQFLSGSTTLTSAALKNLDEAAFLLNTPAYNKLKIEIAGYTDNTGKPATNQAISQQRADAVKAYLEQKGVASSRIRSVGYGSLKPIAENATHEGRSKNRRVEFNVMQ